MQYTVPQFIDVEDKIIGPFSFKQFLYLAGSFGLAYGIYRFLPLAIALPIALGLVVLGIALTFFKVNGMSFVLVMQSFITFVLQSKLYIWKKEVKKEVEKKIEKPANVSPAVKIPRLTESRLSDLSWSLDVLDMREGDE